MKIARKLYIVLFAVLFCLLSCASAFADTDASQVVESGGTYFYKADGTRSSSGTLGQDNVVVEMSKTIADNPNEENEFEVTLNVRTTQDLEVLQNISPDAAVTLVLDISSSMYNDCVACGHTDSEKCHKNGTCSFTNRLGATITAAKNFVQQFSTLETSSAGGVKPKRYVAVIAFNATAETKTKDVGYYVDVASETGLKTVNDILDSLNVTTGSGTNIEGGMLLARNLENHFFGEDSTSDIKHIKYLYTVLLTDGEPYHGASGNNLGSYESIGGTSSGSASQRVDTVYKQADDIKALSPLSMLYTICLGVEHADKEDHDGALNSTLGIKFDYDVLSIDPPIRKNQTTIGDWLNAFSDEVFGDIDTASPDSILSNFDTVFSRMQLAAQAWEVRDQMGPYIEYLGHVDPDDGNAVSFSPASDTITWNLLNSEADPDASDEDEKILGYTYRYKVRLDNLRKVMLEEGDEEAVAYQAGQPTPANAFAVLDYAVHNSQTNEWTIVNNAPFRVPTVKGFEDSLEFTKLLETADESGAKSYKKLSGVTFNIYADGDLITPITSRTTGSDGVIRFDGIPSGHNYIVKEVPQADYANLNDITFSVAYGNVQNVSATLQAANGSHVDEHGNPVVENGSLVAVNRLVPHDTNQIDLEIRKVFKLADGSNIPLDNLSSLGATSTFEITHPQGANGQDADGAPAHESREFQLYYNSPRDQKLFNHLPASPTERTPSPRSPLPSPAISGCKTEPRSPLRSITAIPKRPKKARNWAKEPPTPSRPSVKTM